MNSLIQKIINKFRKRTKTTKKYKNKQTLKQKIKRILGKKADLVKRSFDVVGDIAILEIKKGLTKKQEKEIAKLFQQQNKNIKVVVKKQTAHEGIFRTQKTTWLTGEKRKTTIHKENGIKLYLNIDETYFSVRLAHERERINKLIKPNENVLVMFSGAGPYVVNIAKNTKAKVVYGIEINPKAHEFAEKNLELNKIKNAKVLKGDVREVIPKRLKSKKFDRILMPLPKTADEFLDVALKVSKKGTVIHFYDFLDEKDIPNKAISKIKKHTKNFEVLKVVKCGQQAPRIYRVCIDFKII